jgi:hypothetical protein
MGFSLQCRGHFYSSELYKEKNRQEEQGLFAWEQKSKLIEILHGKQDRIKTGKRGHVSD